MSTAVVKKNPVVDMDKAMIIRSPDGTEIRRIKRLFKLSAAEGTLVKIIGARKAWTDRKTGEVIREAQPATLIPTAIAYTKMAAECGVSIRHPDTVVVGGVEQPNGFCSPDGTYYFRTQAGGYTSNGQPFITDKTVDFNVHRYNIQDLLAKAKDEKNTKYFKVLPFRGVDKDGGFKGSPGESWAGYKIDESVVLWVDCSCPDFVGWLSEMNNRIKNAIRVAQTFADRNAIAAHPALPVQKKFHATEQAVDCVCWYAKSGVNTFNLLDSGNTSVTIDVSSSSLVADDEETRQVVKAEEAAAPVDPTDAVHQPDDEEESQPAEENPKADEPTADEGKGLTSQEAEIRNGLILALKAKKKAKGPMTWNQKLKELNIPVSEWDSASTDALMLLDEALGK